MSQQRSEQRSQQPSEKEHEIAPKKLSEEDQARVERYLHSGYNDVERKPFRPVLLLLIIVGVLTLLSLLSLLIARTKGVV